MEKKSEKNRGLSFDPNDIRRYFLVALFLVVLVGVGGYLGRYSSLQTPSSLTGNQSEVKSAKVISLKGIEGKSVYDLLKDKHKVESQSTSAGIFVTAIDGVKNEESSFWIYYVNGETGTVASDQYKTKNGDNVEWRYEQFNFN